MSHTVRQQLRSVVVQAPRTCGVSGATIQALREAAGAALRRLSRSPRVGRYAFHYEHVLGTSLELQVVATHADVAHRAESVVLAEVDRLAQILSGYSASSELSRWQCTHGVAVQISPELADVLEAAESWRVRTRGAFNAAAISLVDLLRDTAAPGVDATMHDDDVPQRRVVRDRLGALDESLWTVDRVRGRACRITRLPVSLDALAKGYIVDRAAAVARDVDGVSQVLVNIGGDLRHFGPRALSVSVTDPREPAENGPPIAMVSIRDAALATSGGYRRGFVLNGCRVSHILDPRTGLPAESIASASVLAPDCATADALSTAFSVMAPQESVAFADAIPNVGCLLVQRDGTVTTNAAWDARALPVPYSTTHSRN
ncbi:MAG: apbE 4 [Gemmatimonadetes bacterium]|nr:apbE 4 [Gemmatimonadota bacterium]